LLILDFPYSSIIHAMMSSTFSAVIPNFISVTFAVVEHRLVGSSSDVLHCNQTKPSLFPSNTQVTKYNFSQYSELKMI